MIFFKSGFQLKLVLEIKLTLHSILSLTHMKYSFLFLALLAAQLNFAQDYPDKLLDFEILTLEGDKFSKEQVQKDSYTYFIYFSPTCGHCQNAFKFLNLKADQIENADVQIYPVSSNTEKETMKFFNTYASKIQNLENVHILRDIDFKFADKFDVVAFPTSFLYDKNHHLVKVFESSSEVLLFLKELE